MTDETPKRKLKIDLAELDTAMDNRFYEHTYYLDVETGQVLLVSDETRSQLEKISDESDDKEFDLETALKTLDIQDWEKDAIREAKNVEEGFGEKYIEVPRVESREGYEDMELFTETIKSERIKLEFARALSKNHPFSHFKDALDDNPDEQKLWYKFKEDRQRERILEWLEEEGIEPIL